jgi:hypothetical protein
LAGRVTVLQVGGTLSERGRELLSAADLAVATRALEDPEGHRGDPPVEPVVVLRGRRG